jgi:hypothetical protein
MNIIDELGVINQTIAELDATARRLKARIIAERGIGQHDGEKFFADVQEYDRTTISPKLVRELVDPDIVSAVTEIKHIQAVVVKQKVSVL